MDIAQMYPGMPVMVHFSYERFSPEYSRVEAVHPDQNPWRSTVTILSPGDSRRVFLAGAQVLDGDFGYMAYFNTLEQELASDMRADEAEEGLRRYRLAWMTQISVTYELPE